jgi:hypothetical protein
MLVATLLISSFDEQNHNAASADKGNNILSITLDDLILNDFGTNGNRQRGI